MNETTAILEPPVLMPTAHLNGQHHDGTNSSLPPLQTPAPPAPAMLEKAILLQIDVKRMGNARKVNNDCVAADTDKDLIRVSKTLLDSNELKAIRALDSEIKSYIKRKCLPSVLRKGVFLLPLTSISKVNVRLDEFSAQRQTLVENFVAVYPNLIEAARMRLRELFSEDDYPPADQVQNLFSLSWNYVSFGVPESLATIDQALFEEQKQKQAAQWQEAQSVVQDLLRARTLEMVAHMTERLAPGADGKAKTFRNSMIENIDEFLEDFDSLNVTGDAELAALVASARELLNGVDAQTLRRSADLRASLSGAFGEIETQLNSLLVDKPTRMVSFEDE